MAKASEQKKKRTATPKASTASRKADHKKNMAARGLTAKRIDMTADGKLATAARTKSGTKTATRKNLPVDTTADGRLATNPYRGASKSSTANNKNLPIDRTHGGRLVTESSASTKTNLPIDRNLDGLVTESGRGTKNIRRPVRRKTY